MTEASGGGGVGGARTPPRDRRTRASQLKWLTLFRVALVMALLAATVVFNLQDTSQLSDRLYVYLYYLCTVVFVVSFAYTIGMRLLRSERHLTALTWVQFTGDILFAAAIVLVTGGSDSVFTFFFSLVIIGGAIVLFRPGALYLATLSSTLVLTIGLIEIGVLPWGGLLEEYRLAFLPVDEVLSPIQQVDSFYHMVYNASINIVAFYGVAILAAWLSEQLRRSADQIQTQAERLEELRALHHHIVSSVPTGIASIGTGRRITFFNRAAESITGISAAEATGKDVTTLFRDLRFVLENPHKLTGVSREESLVVLGRRRIYLGWSLSPITDAGGAHIGQTFMFQDITRVKELEQSMHRGRKMAAIGELSAAIAHEIRNPLAAISGSIQLLQSNVALDADDKRLMEIVLRETEQLNSWITDFLDYSRPPPVDRRPMDLNQLVNDALTVFRQDSAYAGIELRCANDQIMPVLADRSCMKQVIWNLLHNAAHAMSGGGAIDVRIIAHTAGSRPTVELQIEDQGDGIAPDQLERIFEPFYTTRARGTGLGLAVVHRIVQDHDGHILVDTEVGRGTNFRIVLPMGTLLADERAKAG